MKENLKDFLLNLLISTFIGLFVGMVEVTFMNMNSEVAVTLIISSIMGGIIGTISRTVYIYIFAIKQINVKIAFITVFIIIGLISCVPSFYYHITENEIFFTEGLVSILLSAELLGMSFCYYSYKKCLNLNLKLTNKKKQFVKK
jgi:uncharacterized membrane protein